MISHLWVLWTVLQLLSQKVPRKKTKHRVYAVLLIFENVKTHFYQTTRSNLSGQGSVLDLSLIVDLTNWRQFSCDCPASSCYLISRDLLKQRHIKNQERFIKKPGETYCCSTFRGHGDSIANTLTHQGVCLGRLLYLSLLFNLSLDNGVTNVSRWSRNVKQQ